MTKDGNFFERWSRRKHASKAGIADPAANAVPPQAAPQAGRDEPASKAGTAGPTADAVPAQAGTQVPAAPPPPLPPVESLTSESDFTPFLREGVDPGVKRAALKVLLNDPRFNVMDGLDVYIDDYSKPDPLPEGWLEKLNQAARLGLFKEAPEAAAAEADPTPPPVEKKQEEQKLADESSQSPPDTSSRGIPPPKVQESGS